MTTERAPRLMGFWMCAALVVGNLIGSGIFLLPASLAALGRNAVSGWIISACGAMALALVFARLSRAHPVAGGPYAFTRLAFGEFPALVVAWGYWVSVWVGNAAIAAGAVAYLSMLIPWVGRTQATSAAATLGAVWLFTYLNCLGVRTMGKIQVVTTVMKLLPLAAMGLLALIFLPGHARPMAPAPLTWGATGTATILTLWAMIGLESATIPADRIRDPRRNVPRATLIATGLTALVCALACTVVMVLVPAGSLAVSNAPFADAARILWGGRAATLITVFAAVSGFGALNGWIFLQGELPRTMAREGVFPAIFARESRRQVPVLGHVITSGLVTVLVLLNFHQSLVDIFTFMVLLATTTTLVAYLVCSLAVLQLLRRRAMGEGNTDLPWLAPVGVLGAAYSLWAIAGAGPRAVLWGFALLLLAVPIWFGMRRVST